MEYGGSERFLPILSAARLLETRASLQYDALFSRFMHKLDFMT